MLKNQKNSKKQANVGIGIAIGYFSIKGITVCIPLTDSQEYDLVIEDVDDIFKKIQVKTTYHKSSQGNYMVELIGCESVLCCWIYKKIFIPYVSAGDDQAQELIIHAKTIIEHARFNIPLRGALKDQTKAEIYFENGSRIKTFASNNPRGIRGPRALIAYMDEFAFNKYPQEVMSAVEFMASEGGQVNVLSTPYGKQNLFWQIYADRGNFVNYHRHYISLFDKMSDFNVRESLFDFVKRTGAKLTCPWLSLDFLENKRKSDAPFQYANFLQEAVGVAIEEITAIITEAMLDGYGMEEYFIISIHCFCSKFAKI